MRFLLYNIRYGTGGRRPTTPLSGYLRRTSATLEAITGFIRSVDADIVGLLEVDGGSYRFHGRSQARYIAHTLGHYHSYQHKYGDSFAARWVPMFAKQGNAFIVRDRIHNERFHYFNKGVKRLVIELELEALDVFLVHLAVSFRTRRRQLEELVALTRRSRRPRIVAGDFNLLRGRRELAWFLKAAGLKDAGGRPVPTFPSWRPRRQLDYILHTPDIEVDRFTVPAVRYSDHLPLVCDFRTPPASESR
ncbi:MAG: endonuclease/exonuclease/phosphatase family protein [Lentisphaerae bacterium]|nr:endonuclease/exonuclease/phosphatase family protein [Lentisphaerota bacterium]